MDNLQFLTEQTSEALQSVGLQLRGANTTIDKMKEESNDKYNRMNEMITTMEKRMTILALSTQHRSRAKCLPA